MTALPTPRSKARSPRADTAPLTYDSVTGRISSALVTITMNVIAGRRNRAKCCGESELSLIASNTRFRPTRPASSRKKRRRCSALRKDFRKTLVSDIAGGVLMRSFAASDRFVADVKARKLAPGYVFIGDEAFFRKRCRDADSATPGARRRSRTEPLRHGPGRGRVAAGAGPRAHAVADVALPGFLHSRHQEPLRPRQARRRVRRHRGVFQESQSRRDAGFRRRPRQHSGRCSPHGPDRQRPLRAHSRDPGRVLHRAGVCPRGGRRRGEVGHRDRQLPRA